MTASKISANAVTADKISSSSVTADKIATGAVTTAKIDAGAVTAVKIAAGAITTDKLAANAVTAAKINVNDLFSQNITATGTITGAKLRGTDAVITKGTVGGFTIGTNTIYSNTSGVQFAISSVSNSAAIQIKQSNTQFSRMGLAEIEFASNSGYSAMSPDLTTTPWLQAGNVDVSDTVKVTSAYHGTDVTIRAGYDTGVVIENANTADGANNKAG